MNTNSRVHKLPAAQKSALQIAARRFAEEQGITTAAAVERIAGDPKLLQAMRANYEAIGPAVAGLLEELSGLYAALSADREPPPPDKSKRTRKPPTPASRES